jgi:hypothetical protein
MPGVAWHGTAGTAIDRPLPMNETLLARRGLYATMSYVDSLVDAVARAFPAQNSLFSFARGNLLVISAVAPVVS